jgi:RND family efflux transporter MFP subunit
VYTACGLLAAVVVGGLFALQGLPPRLASAGQHAETDPEGPEPGAADEHHRPVPVEVVTPRKLETERTTTQPGTAQAFESARLFAEVSGYLKKQTVDYGDRVKKGQVLAVVDVPELHKQLERNQAGHKRAQAVVAQMKARVATAEAELEESKAGVNAALADARSKVAFLRFRDQQLERFRQLVAEKSIDPRTADEKWEQRDAALEAKNAADAAVFKAKARVVTVTAKIEQARADVAAAEADVEVARSEWEKSQVLVQFATITSPYDGVITQRNQFPGDFVRSAAEGAVTPLLVVERTDLLRVVVLVPDADVPFVDPGDPATLQFEALPGEKFEAKVCRLSRSEDPQTRLMHVEVDLPNPGGRIVAGMFGKATIHLERVNVLAVPASCLATRKSDDREATLFVVRSGHARELTVRIGAEIGSNVPVLVGLRADDLVVLHPGGLEDGQPVTMTGPGA